jgi:hypothetical protein
MAIEPGGNRAVFKPYLYFVQFVVFQVLVQRVAGLFKPATCIAFVNAVGVVAGRSFFGLP